VTPLIELAPEQVQLLQERGLKGFRVSGEEEDGNLKAFGKDLQENIGFVIVSPESIRKKKVKAADSCHEG